MHSRPPRSLHRSPRALLRRLVGASLLAVLAALGLGGCDNPACVFGGTCSGGGGNGGGGIGSSSAVLPDDHAWLVSGDPTITDVFPKGNTAHSETPVIVVFSESMAPSTVLQSFLIFEVGGIGAPTATRPLALVAEGRVLVLVPALPLRSNTTYEVRFAPMAVVSDLTGNTLTQPATGVVGSFTTAATNPAVPRVVTSWPMDGARNRSTTGEMIVAFDRPMLANTVTLTSFLVEVDGVAPTFNPRAQPIQLDGGGQTTLPETRVFTYRSVDNNDEPAYLTEGGHVELRLSPAGNKIRAEDLSLLPATTLEFDLAPISAPRMAEVVSLPFDAIGIDNLDGTVPLDVAVEIPGGLVDDRIGVFLFGESKTSGDLIALFRSVRLGDVPYDMGTGIATLGEAELDLASSVSPVTSRFAEGAVGFAFRVQRGNAIGPVRLLDTDPLTEGIQNPLVDTVRPVLVGFGDSGTDTTNFRSNLPGLSLFGRASERLRAIEVSTALGNNGMLTEVSGSNDSGLFVAAPVSLPQLAPGQMPLAFTADFFDLALNRAVNTANGLFTQVGGVGPGNALPGNATVDVQVVDARTLLPIQGAMVFVHADQGGAPVFVDVDVTPASGSVTLTAPGAGQTIVTVDSLNHDLFSYHGLPRSRISVPLSRTNEAPGLLSGVVSSTNSDLPLFARFVGDNRLFEAGEPVVPVTSCSFNPLTRTYDCAFGPTLVRPGPVAGAAFAAVEFPAGVFDYSPQTFLRGFGLRLPVFPVRPGLASVVTFQIDPLLDEAATDRELRALDGPRASLTVQGVAGLNLASLNGDPRISVRAQARGLTGTLLTGFGAPLDPVGSPAHTWELRTAIPGIADPTDMKYPGDRMGDLVLAGTIDPDMFVHAEVRDTLGNRAGRRPRWSAMPAVIVPQDVAVISAPAPGGNSGVLPYDVVFTNAIPDAGGQPGLYRVTLVGSGGRRWNLWREDGNAASGATRRISLPDLAAVGGTPLGNGQIGATVAAYAWPGLDRNLFLFTEIGREFDRFSESAPILFTQP